LFTLTVYPLPAMLEWHPGVCRSCPWCDHAAFSPGHCDGHACHLNRHPDYWNWKNWGDAVKNSLNRILIAKFFKFTFMKLLCVSIFNYEKKIWIVDIYTC
jgi:hypothetical protein